MCRWLIRQDRPDGGILSFAGTPAFQARWSLIADPPPPPTESLHEQNPTDEDARGYWFRTGEDDDDIIILFNELRWQDAPPEPERAQRLMAKAVCEINDMIGERF